jgi:hypothetical protein
MSDLKVSLGNLTAEFLGGKVLQSSDIILVCHLVEFDMREKLFCATLRNSMAFRANKFDAVILTIFATSVMCTDDTGSGCNRAGTVINILARVFRKLGNLCARIFTRAYWIVFCAVEILNEKCYDSNLVRWQVNFAFLGLLWFHQRDRSVYRAAYRRCDDFSPLRLQQTHPSSRKRQ